MNSTGLIFLILAIVFMLALIYLCCWWYCTQRRCCGVANHKKSNNGPAYTRANSLNSEEKPPYTSTAVDNNNISYKNVPYTSSKSEVKYPSAPEAAKPMSYTSMRQSTLPSNEAKYSMGLVAPQPPSSTEAKYDMGLVAPPPPSSIEDLKLQKTSPPSPQSEKKVSLGMVSNPAVSTTSVTQVKEKSYQPLMGSERKYSSGVTRVDYSVGLPFHNTTTISTIAERKMSQLSEKFELPAWTTEKRSASPYRPHSPFEPSASSRHSIISNSDKEFNRYTGIRSFGNTTKPATAKKNVTDEDAEQTVTIKIKADEADKVSSILSKAVLSGELSSAEAVSSEKTVDVKKILERYEHGISTEPEGNATTSSTTVLSGTESKTIVLPALSSSLVPIITTMDADDGGSGVLSIVDNFVSSVQESAPQYSIEKTVITSSQEHGKGMETTMTTRKSSSSIKENEDDSS
uniref:Uncharacterized protein n=1 Tax=Lepeophtheirus salmonis TaxID=72036 RepID=A0A0K2UHW6_LEPSM